MSSSPALRSGPLAMPMRRVSCRPCSASTSAATRDLPFAAVDDQQVRSRKLAGDDPRAASRQRLAHRRVVVAAGGRRHVEAPVLGRLHREPIEDHARGDRALAHRVRNVEALDPLRRGAAARAPPAAQRAGPPASPSARASAGSRTPRSASPSSATRAARRRDCRRSPRVWPACAESTSASASCFVGAGGDDRRRHRPLDVVLREKGRHDLVERAGVGMPREEAAIADVPPAADHDDVDGDEALLRRGGDDVEVSRPSRSRRTAATAAA